MNACEIETDVYRDNIDRRRQDDTESQYKEKGKIDKEI